MGICVCDTVGNVFMCTNNSNTIFSKPTEKCDSESGPRILKKEDKRERNEILNKDVGEYNF